ncbi:MAG: lipopolysaccharide heptosyltransferase I [Desulfobacterales bacterium]
MMKVLIVKSSALGDVVHALPVLNWMASSGMEIEVGWLVEESFAPILESHPLVKRVHILRTRAWRRKGAATAIRQAWKTIRSIRTEAYDTVLDLQGNSKSGLFTLFSGAPVRFGFDSRGVRELPNVLATNRKVSLESSQIHVVDRYLAVARALIPLGDFDSSQKTLHPDSASTLKVERQLRSLGLEDDILIVLHYGTTWKTKLWDLGRWRELARELSRRGRLRMLLTWGNEEEYRAAQAIKSEAGDRAFIWPRGTLAELVALLNRADLVVGGDTGPVHIAAALGTRTVSLFRATDARRNGPRGEGHVHLQAECGCSPCLRRSCGSDRDCSNDISCGQVIFAIDSLLGKETAPGRAFTG